MEHIRSTKQLKRINTSLWTYLEALVPALIDSQSTNPDQDELAKDFLDLDYGFLDIEEIAEANIKERVADDRYEDDSERYGDFDDIEYPDYIPSEEIYHNEQIKDLYKGFNYAIRKRNLLESQEYWMQMLAHIDNSSHLIVNDIKEKIDQILDNIDDFTPVIIYDPKKVEGRIVVPQLIQTVSAALAKEIARYPSLLHNLSPRDFEKFIAEIFSSFGYRVELTMRTRDGGRDIVAIRRENDIWTKLIVECKKFSPNRPVGVQYVRQLYAVKALEKATKAILATTSYFTKDSMELEREHIYELELKDFSAVTSWAKEYSHMLRQAQYGNK